MEWLPQCREFRALSDSYSRFRWYSITVQDRPTEVVVTLAPIHWPSAIWWAAIVAILWSLLNAAARLANPEPLNYLRAAGVGTVVCLFPLYFPFLRLLLLKGRLPWIRFDRDLEVVYLLGGSRQVPIGDVIAICDVIGPSKPGSDGDYIDKTYELQLLLKKHRGTECVLLSGGWHYSAKQAFAPVTRDIAHGLGIRHFSVDTERGTIVELSAKSN